MNRLVLAVVLAAVAAAGTVRQRLPAADREPAERKSAVAPSLRLEGRNHVELEGSRGLLDLSRDFTIEIWARWDMSLRDFRMQLAGDEAWPAMSPDLPVERPCGWVLRANPMEGADQRRVEFAAGATIDGKDQWFRVTTDPAATKPSDWQHLAVCKSKESVKLFWNGKLAAQASCRGVTFQPAPTNLYLGVRKGGWTDRQFHGDIRAFRVVSRALYKKDFDVDESFQPHKGTLVSLTIGPAEGPPASPK